MSKAFEPWSYKVESQVRYDVLTGEKSEKLDHWVYCENRPVALICNRNDEAKKESHLVAAAPEMLEVLEMIVNNDKELFSEKLHAVIAKAKGETR